MRKCLILVLVGVAFLASRVEAFDGPRGAGIRRPGPVRDIRFDRFRGFPRFGIPRFGFPRRAFFAPPVVQYVVPQAVIPQAIVPQAVLPQFAEEGCVAAPQALGYAASGFYSQGGVILRQPVRRLFVPYRGFRGPVSRAAAFGLGIARSALFGLRGF